MDQVLSTAVLVTQARQERERLRLAEAWAQEVLARVAGQETATDSSAPSVVRGGSHEQIDGRLSDAL